MSAAGSIIEIATARIRPFATQPREYFDAAALRDLEHSIKAVGQQVEIIVRPVFGDPEHRYELIDGQRRWLACSKLGISIRACVRGGVRNAEDQFLTSWVANFSRAEHTPAEIAKAIARLRKRPEIAALSAGEQVQHIADISGRSVPWVYSYENLLKLDPEVLALTSPPTPKKKRITLQAAALLSALPITMQRELAESAARMTARRLERLIRGTAKKSGIKIRANKPSQQRKRSETSLNAVAAAAEALVELAGDFKAIFATRSRDEQE